MFSREDMKVILSTYYNTLKWKLSPTDSLGTCLIFRESGNILQGCMQLNFPSVGKELKYECSTNKKLCMSRVLLKKKTALQDNSTENNTTHKAT